MKAVWLNSFVAAGLCARASIGAEPVVQVRSALGQLPVDSQKASVVLIEEGTTTGSM